MGTFQRPNRLFFLAIIGLSTILAACSSGGGSSGKAANDTRPDPFTLIAPTGVDLEEVAFDTPIVSDPVTIKGIDTAAPVSIEGGEYAIGDGEFTNAPGTVRNGQQIRVRVQSPIKAEQTASVTLNIGGVTESFTVTTGPDTVPPEVAILFPPPASMTEGQTLFMRGTVKDANGTLEEGAVKVNEVYADLKLNEAGDEGTWEVTVDLAPGENTVTVTAADTAENVNDEESVASRRVESIAGESFPDNQNPFGASINADIGWEDGKPVAYVADDTALKVFKVDLTTGVRTVLAGNEEVEEELLFEEPWGIHLGTNGKLYVSDFTKGAIFDVDRETGTRSVLAASDEQSFWDSPTGMLLRVEQGQEKLYVADERGKVFWIDVATGEQKLIVNSRDGLNPGGEQFSSVFGFGLMDNKVIATGRGGLFVLELSGEQHPFYDSGIHLVSSMVKSAAEQKLYYVNNSEYRIYSLDAASKQSTVLSGEGVNGEENEPKDVWGIASHRNLAYLLIVDRKNGLIAMDHESNKRVVISKSAPVEP